MLEHMAGATIADVGPDSRWLEGIDKVADLPNTFLKVFHVIQSKDRDTASPGLDRYEPWLTAAWDAFGEGRLNWPVSGRHASYARIHDLVQQFVAGRGTEAPRRFFVDNARRAYRLVDPG